MASESLVWKVSQAVSPNRCVFMVNNAVLKAATGRETPA